VEILKKALVSHFAPFYINLMGNKIEISWRCNSNVISKHSAICSACGEKIHGGKKRVVFSLVEKENKDRKPFYSINSCLGGCAEEIEYKLWNTFYSLMNPHSVFTMEIVLQKLKKKNIVFSSIRS
jgi:hypothetical protein